MANASSAAGLVRWMWKALLRGADAIVSCSDAQRRSVLEFAPFVRARSATVHNGIDVDQLMSSCNPAARMDPRLHGERFILSVASYEPKKGLDTLVRAFGALRNQHGVDVKLALVGRDRGTGAHLRHLAAQLGVLEQVVFCGEVPHRDLHAYYRSAAVFCLASRMEPFGIVLLEAGAFRCPVVATAVGGIPEFLTHDVTARLVTPEDPAALAAELRRLLSDGNLRDRLADALYEHATTQCTWRNGHRSYVKVIELIE
jgi:glycosyltransferase involved in cell wall biosynthesis